MPKALWIVAVLVFMLAGALGAAFYEGWVRVPWASRYVELEAQLRDHGPVAVVGATPLGLRVEGGPLVPVARAPGVSAALAGRAPEGLVAALRAEHFDALMVRPGAPAVPGSVGATLTARGAVAGLSAGYVDPVATVYAPAERVEVSADDAARMVSVARLIMSGAVAPPERLFPESLRRSRPVELALVLREGHEPVIWRSARAGSLARALIDVSLAVLDRWATRQQDNLGRLRDALNTRSLTLAVFYEKGVLGARDEAFLRSVAASRVWSLGYERTTGWEYALPLAPWQSARDPVRTLAELTRDRGVPAPGYLRPELTLYRFRALQLIEESPGGPVQRYDPE
ncbi:MAG: hypothetical protein JNK72_07765 [Myxococcales bacterium]|nr:hypothetical protein [Myxococcales bacterium]